jgi:hypothetical protein
VKPLAKQLIANFGSFAEVIAAALDSKRPRTGKNTGKPSAPPLSNLGIYAQSACRTGFLAFRSSSWGVGEKQGKPNENTGKAFSPAVILP